MRCDRVDFPLGGIAHRHTHPGPGIRYLLQGEIEIETEGRSTFYGPGGAWFESGPEPVLARRLGAPRDVVRPRALLPAEWAGKRTIRYLDPADERPAEAAARDGPPRARRSRSRGEPHAAAGSSSTSSPLHGADLAFGVPGESYLDVLDALRDTPDPVRHVPSRGRRREHGGGRTASSPARPGICLVTRGPGATHASVGVHTAYQDATPLLLLVGQIPRERCRARGLPGDRLPPHVRHRSPSGSRRSTRSSASRSSRHARSGPRPRGAPARSCSRSRRTCSRHAPTCRTPCPTRRHRQRPRPPTSSARGGCCRAPSVRSRSSAASRGARRRARTLAAWCEASGIPVAAAWRCQDYVDNDVARAMRAISDRRRPGAPRPPSRRRRAARRRRASRRHRDRRLHDHRPPGGGRALIHVHPDPDEIGRVYEPDGRDRRLRAAVRRGPSRGSSPSARARGTST